MVVQQKKHGNLLKTAEQTLQWMWVTISGVWIWKVFAWKVALGRGGSGAQLEAQWSITARGSPFQEGSSHMFTSQFQTSYSQRKICRLVKRSSVIWDGCCCTLVLYQSWVGGMELLTVLKTRCVIIVQCPVSEVLPSYSNSTQFTPLICIW